MSNAQHKTRVQRISEEVRHFYLQKKKVRIFHGSTHSTRAQTFTKGEVVDVSDLNNILEINTTKKIAVVEPNVPMDALVKETLKQGFVPPVVMEFPGITVGGGIQGGAEESSSFKFGLFHDTALKYEMVTGDGKCISVSREKNPDLFWGTACSYGSLGILTSVTLHVIPAKPFVILTYVPVTHADELISKTEKMCGAGFDFIDGILFSENRGVVMAGQFADEQTIPKKTFRRAQDQWFYLHADAVSRRGSTYQEQIPLQDYLFRYDRGAFWMGRYGFKRLHIPFNRLTRFVMNPLCDTRTLYQLLHATRLSQQYFIQDVGVPNTTIHRFLEEIQRELHIFPIWICPITPGSRDLLSHNALPCARVYNVGIWGEARGTANHFQELNRRVEKTMQILGGRKMLYAHQYYTREEFWNIYNRTWYTQLRNTYHAADVFPDVYEKTVVTSTYKPSLAKGLLRLIASRLKIIKQ